MVVRIRQQLGLEVITLFPIDPVTGPVFFDFGWGRITLRGSFNVVYNTVYPILHGLNPVNLGFIEAEGVGHYRNFGRGNYRVVWSNCKGLNH